MYKELVRRNVIIIALSLVLFFVLSLFVINFVNRRNLQNELVNISGIIGESIEKTKSEEEIRSVINDYTDNRDWITVVIANSYGDVIIDSSEDNVGEGVVRRLEPFEMEKLGLPGNAGAVYVNGGRIFYIERLNDDIVFRTSIEITNNTNFILLGVFCLLAVLLVMLAASIYFNGRTSARITEAFENIASHLSLTAKGGYEEIEEDDRYEEVSRAYRGINAVNNSIYSYITRISAERDKLNHIIEQINEGLIIIGTSGKVYSINDYARNIFGVGQVDENTVYTDFIKSEKCLKMIDKEIKTGKELRFDYHDKTQDNIYLVTLNCFRNEADADADECLISAVFYDITALRREEQIKADFIANASHELKTPITSISGFSELLLSGLVTQPEDVKKYVSNIYGSAVEMKNTINELLYLSKLDNSDEITSGAEVDLAALAENCINRYRKSAEIKGVKMRRKGKSALIFGDESLLEHMLGNLVDNAIKYNRSGGTVIVETGTDGEKKFVRVTDNGCGIEPQHLNKLFERFYRVENSRNRETGGTGLGLTIVQKICTLHKAEIQIESEYGQGSTFTVVFGKEENNA